MTQVRLTFGPETLAFDVAGDVRTLAPTYAPRRGAEEAEIDRALDEPLGTPPLVELARGRRSAVVLIACRTRRTGSAVFLPRIVRALNAAGIADERITVYAATGTHDNWRPQDAALLAGPDCARHVRFMGHDCRANLAEVGTTSRGNRVWLSRTYLEADLRVATGRVTYHYFAGFTGGRKAIVPGVAGFDTIVFNHRMASQTAPQVGLTPEACNGNLDTNPIHQDMLEAARLAPPEFTLSTVLDARNEIVHAFGGDMEASHAAAVAKVRLGDAPAAEQPADWLFLSCGGAHCDVNAVQAMKAVINNHQAVRRGGAIVFAAQCPEGMAPWLRELCGIGDRAELERRIGAGELRHPHNALFLRRVTEHAQVVMVTDLPGADVAALGFHKADSPAAAVALATRLAGAPGRSYVVPFGNTTVVRMSGAEAA